MYTDPRITETGLLPGGVGRAPMPSRKGRGTRRPYKTGLATRQSIVDGAVRALISNGYAQASLQMVAVETGVSKAVVYYHFPAKSALMAAVVDHCASAIEERFRMAAGSFAAPPEGRMNAVCSFVAALLDEHAPELRILSELSAHAPRDPGLCDALRRHSDVATAALSVELAASGARQGPGGAMAAARTLLATLHGILLMRDYLGPLSPSRAAFYADVLAAFAAPSAGRGFGVLPRPDARAEDPSPDGRSARYQTQKEPTTVPD